MYLSTHTIHQLRQIQKLLDQLHPKADPLALSIPGLPEPHDNIIVFTGSFNPPTRAHLALLKQAQYYAHQHEPMHVYTAFSKLTVDKEKVERPLLLDRIMLLKRVLHRHLPRAGIVLFNRGLYVEQAEALRCSFPKVRRILFLMGFDKIVQIFDPHYYEDRDAALSTLFSMAELLVAPRGNGGEHEIEELIHQPQNERFARYVHTIPFNPDYREVSSTHIRQGGSAYAHDVPQEVRVFMRDTRAYAPPLRKPDGSQVDYYEERVRCLRQQLAIPLS
jgi:nicotinic acid mononucleotide adenylyltransferase